MFSYFEGYKTYFVAYTGMLASSLGLVAHQVSLSQEIFNIIALLIVMALRAAMKTETGRLAAQVVTGLQTQVPIPEAPAEPAKTLTEEHVDKILAAIKDTLTQVPPPPDSLAPSTPGLLAPTP